MYFDRKAKERNRKSRRQFELSKTKDNQVEVNFDYNLMVNLLMRGSKDEFLSYASSCKMDTDWITSTWNKYRENSDKDSVTSI